MKHAQGGSGVPLWYSSLNFEKRRAAVCVCVCQFGARASARAVRRLLKTNSSFIQHAHYYVIQQSSSNLSCTLPKLSLPCTRHELKKQTLQISCEETLQVVEGTALRMVPCRSNSCGTSQFCDANQRVQLGPIFEGWRQLASRRA